MTAGEVKTECAWKLAQACADLDEAESEGVELYPRRIADGLDEPPAERIQQPVGGCMQQQTEGICPEAVIAQAVRFDGVLQVLEPVLGFTSVDVPVIDCQRVLLAGSNDKLGPLPSASAL
jgi:hypothetical protein